MCFTHLFKATEHLLSASERWEAWEKQWKEAQTAIQRRGGEGARPDIGWKLPGAGHGTTHLPAALQGSGTWGHIAHGGGAHKHQESRLRKFQTLTFVKLFKLKKKKSGFKSPLKGKGLEVDGAGLALPSHRTAVDHLPESQFSTLSHLAGKNFQAFSLKQYLVKKRAKSAENV